MSSETFQAFVSLKRPETAETESPQTHGYSGFPRFPFQKRVSPLSLGRVNLKRAVKRGLLRASNQPNRKALVMFIDKPLEAPTPKQLASALSALVDALMKRRAKRKPGNGIIEGITCKALMDTPSEVLDARDWVHDPIECALKEAMGRVGQLLYNALGDTDALGDAVDKICKPRSREFASRMSALDSALNGVGRDRDRWHS